MDELNWINLGEATECSCGYTASHECNDVSYEVAQARAPQAGVPLRRPTETEIEYWERIGLDWQSDFVHEDPIDDTPGGYDATDAYR